MVFGDIVRTVPGEELKLGRVVTQDDRRAAEASLPKKSKTEIKSNDRWFVYLLRCADGTLYTGIAIDLTRRVKQHNAGTASRYTRSRLPVVLVYQEPQPSRSLALKKELAVKALSRRDKESMIQAAVVPRRRVQGK